jgi:ElaB/YqjD/DUF883 family membrane-anchored ribosome-binding protein
MFMNTSTMARDTAKDAKDAVKEATRAASVGAKDVQEDLEALRDDVARLTQQLAGIVTAKGNKAWRRAKSGVGDAISDAQDMGMEAVGAVREVGDNVVDAIDESLRRRPYTTLALAAGIGFLFGATWRR